MVEPPGSTCLANVDDALYISIDVGTTGLRKDQDRIFHIFALRLDSTGRPLPEGAPGSTFCCWVDTQGVQISSHAAQVTGTSAAALYERTDLLTQTAAAEELCKWLTLQHEGAFEAHYQGHPVVRPITLVTYNGWAFDLPMLLQMCRREQVTWPACPLFLLDLLIIQRQTKPKVCPTASDNKLSTVYKEVTGEELINGHEAKSACRAAARIFCSAAFFPLRHQRTLSLDPLLRRYYASPSADKLALKRRPRNTKDTRSASSDGGGRGSLGGGVQTNLSVTSAIEDLEHLSLGRLSLVGDNAASEPSQTLSCAYQRPSIGLSPSKVGNGKVSGKEARGPTLSTPSRLISKSPPKTPSAASDDVVPNFPFSILRESGTDETLRYLVIDLETTGLHRQRDRIFQIGAVCLDNRGQPLCDDHPDREFCRWVDTEGVPVNPQAAEVTGISTARLLEREDLVSQSRAAADFRQWLMCHHHDGFNRKDDQRHAARGRPLVLVTYNGRSFDLPMLLRMFSREQVVWPDIPLFHLDLLVVQRHTPGLVCPNAPNNKLGTIYKEVTGQDLLNGHDAIADCRATAVIFGSEPFYPLRHRWTLSLDSLVEQHYLLPSTRQAKGTSEGGQEAPRESRERHLVPACPEAHMSSLSFLEMEKQDNHRHVPIIYEADELSNAIDGLCLG